MSTPELRPSFVATVTLDGDDDAQIQTGNARAALDAALSKMQDEGLIRGYELTVSDLSLIPSETNEP